MAERNHGDLLVQHLYLTGKEIEVQGINSQTATQQNWDQIPYLLIPGTLCLATYYHSETFI